MSRWILSARKSRKTMPKEWHASTPLSELYSHHMSITCVTKCSSHLYGQTDIYKYNETIEFSCFEGFYLQATQIRRCTMNGTLQPPYPICKVITCQRPILTSELHLTSNPFRQMFYFNESVYFFCSVGFYLQGSSIKNCTKSDDFQHELPSCSNITCKKPNFTTTSALQLSTNTLQEIFSFNDSISFTCTLGYTFYKDPR